MIFFYFVTYLFSTSFSFLSQQHGGEVASPACASAWLQVRDMPASKPGQRFIPHQQHKRKRGVEKGPRPAGIWQIGSKGVTVVAD